MKKKIVVSIALLMVLGACEYGIKWVNIIPTQINLYVNNLGRELSPSEKQYYPDEKIVIHKFMPSTPAKDFILKSNDLNIAEIIHSNYVRAVKPGKTIIKLIPTNKKYTGDTCIVYVKNIKN